jgi:uncharacterized Zn finger protein
MSRRGCGERSVRVAVGRLPFVRARTDILSGRAGAPLHRRRDGVTATVDGTSVYRVTLENTVKGLYGRCSCPYGQEGMFCKHCVATPLAWLDGGGEVGEPRSQPVTDERLRRFLLGQEPAWLVLGSISR